MRILICLAFLLFFGSNFRAQISEYPLVNSSLLWKIEGNGLEEESYLFGTMHLIEKDYFIFPSKLEKLVKKSDVLIMELDGLPKPSEALKYVMLKEGSFFDFFNEEQTDSILDWAKSDLGMSEATFRKTMGKMKPFVIAQMNTQKLFEGKTESYEKSFQEIAEKSKVEIQGLETIGQQMAFFDSLSKEDQAQMVMENIRNSNESVEMTKQMQQIYARQNIDSLYMLVDTEGGYLEENQNAFLDDRNKNWIPKIEETIKTKKTFIAVGAAHLGGPNGVVRLLQKEGYILTPVEL